MPEQQPSRVNDPAIVRREYETEDRFLARRLSASAELRGPLVEEAAIAAVSETGATRILDIGCGTGDFTERLQREGGATVVGLDQSPRMAGLTGARGVPAVIGDIEALPFVDGAFDCAVANRVLYHVSDLDRGLAEVRRVLSLQGRLVTVTYSTHHLHELGQLVGRPSIETPFSAENGGLLLRRHFERVEQQDLSGSARFPDRASILQFLAAYGELVDDDLSARLPEVETPFDATYRHSVLVAHKRVQRRRSP